METREETNNKVTKTNKYFVVRLDDDRGSRVGGPYTLKEAMDNVKKWSKDGASWFITEAKMKFEVEPKMTKVQ